MSQTIYPRWVSNSLDLQQGGYSVINPSNASTTTLGNLSSFTFEVAIYLPSETNDGVDFSGTGSLLDYTDYSTDFVGYKLFISDFNLGIQFGTNSFVADKPLSIGSWHTVAASYDAVSNELSLYVDGDFVLVQVITPPSIGAAELAYLIVGANYSHTPIVNNFVGRISSIKIWDVCRSQGEILCDFINTGTPFYHITSDSSDEPTYTETLVSPILNVDFSKMPVVDASGQNFLPEFWEPARLRTSIPAAHFSGTEYASAADPRFHIDSTSSFTVEGWFYYSGMGDGYPTIVSCGNEYQVWLYGTGKLSGARNSVECWYDAQLTPNTYYHFALAYSYNKEQPALSTLNLFINGNLVSSVLTNEAVTTQPDADFLIGTAYASDNSSDKTDFFTGGIQNINFWRIGLNEGQVRQWMYNQVVDADDVVAAIDFSIVTPVETSNEIPITSTAVFVTDDTFVSASVIAFPPMPVNNSYLKQKDIAIEYYPPIQTSPKVQPAIFSEAHKQATFEGVKKFKSTFTSEEQFKKRFEKAYAQAQQIMDKDPRLKKVITRIDKDGITTLIYHGRRQDQVIYEKTTGFVSECTLWWISFVYTFMIGFLEGLGIHPGVGGTAEKIYAKMMSNTAVRNALVELTTATISLENALDVIEVMNSQKMLWAILKLLLVSLGWMALAGVLTTILGIVLGVEAVTFIVGMIIWVAQLSVLLAQYRGTCGTSESKVVVQ